MFLMAHAGHWAIGALEFAPLVVVAAFAAWRTYVDRRATGPA